MTTNILETVLLVTQLLTNRGGVVVQETRAEFEWRGKEYRLPFHNETFIKPGQMKRKVKAPPLPKQVKAKRMFFSAPTPPVPPPNYSGPPPLPMTNWAYQVDSEYGTMEAGWSALQPSNNAVLFELSRDLKAWEFLAEFESYPADQRVYAEVLTYADKLTVRATAIPRSPRAITAASAGVRINPKYRVKAWVEKRR